MFGASRCSQKMTFQFDGHPALRADLPFPCDFSTHFLFQAKAFRSMFFPVSGSAALSWSTKHGVALFLCFESKRGNGVVSAHHLQGRRERRERRERKGARGKTGGQPAAAQKFRVTDKVEEVLHGGTGIGNGQT